MQWKVLECNETIINGKGISVVLVESKEDLVTARHAVQQLFLFYLLSHFLILLNINGLYWDDWVLYNQNFDELKDMFSQLTGNMHFLEYVYYYIGIIGNGVLPFRMAVFVLYFLSGVFLYLILKDVKFISKKTAFYVALIFLILPVNNAKVALCVAPYGFFNTAFFLAFWLLTKYLNKPNRVFLRLVILALFFISFYVSSLLVFYSIALLYIFYKVQERHEQESVFSNIKTVCCRYPDFLCLPAFFWVIKNTCFVPYGLYENYNHVALGYVKSNLFSNIMLTIKSAFYEPLVQSVRVSFVYFALFILVFLLVFFIVNKKNKQNASDSDVSVASALLLMGIGVVSFLLAIVPYNVVGKIPDLYNFESRHMLLIPLGISLIVYSLILLIKKRSTQGSTFILMFLLASFTLKNNYDQTQYLEDSFYQASIEEQFKANQVVKENTTFVFKSDIPFAMKRSMQFYESSGRLRKVFGDDKRFMADNYHEILLYQDYKKYKRYNYSGWTLSPPIRVVVNMNKTQVLSLGEGLKLLSFMLFDKNAYQKEVMKLTTIHTEPMKVEGT